MVEIENIIDEEKTLSPSSGQTSFYYSFSFLPKDEREAVNTVYAFCRKIDDIVDENPTLDAEVVLRKRRRLAWWRSEVAKCYSDETPSPLLIPLATIIKRFSLPKQYFMQIIDGCERDLSVRRYETFAELKSYCYDVASVVGLICIEIFGYRFEETKEYAINLGYALQLTNILRDVKTDKDRGYIYLPKEDLQRFHLTDQDIIDEVYDERFIALMQFEARRAREFYHKARTALRRDERMTLFAAQIMDSIYYRLLEKIELKDYNIYGQRIKVSTAHKFIIALRLWISNKVFVRRIKPEVSE